MQQDVGPILIVDDEEDLLNLLAINLRREGFSTLTAANARDAMRLARAQTPALVILDLMLPDLPGTEVCRRLRADPDTSRIPIIILSAKGEEIDRVVGFEVGADDYVVKSSFSVRELVLRVRAVLRRGVSVAGPEPDAPPADDTPSDRLVYGELSIDEAGHRVFVGDDEVPLTPTEFKLLATMAQREGRVLTRGVLLEEVWDLPPDLATRTVDTHIKRVREKLGTAARFLETVRGVGYRFNAQATE